MLLARCFRAKKNWTIFTKKPKMLRKFVKIGQKFPFFCWSKELP